MAFDLNSAKEEAPSGGFDLSSAKEDNGTSWYKNLAGTSDPVEAALKVPAVLGDVLLGNAGGMIGSVLPPVKGLLYGAVGAGDAEKVAAEEAAKWNYNPSTETGKTILDAEGHVINNVLVPAFPLMHLATGAPRFSEKPNIAENIRRNDLASREAEVPTMGSKNFDQMLQQKEATKFDTESAVPIEHRSNESQQLPLFDQPEQGRTASPFEASIGEWRVDENGMPIRADLSMDVQHVQEPLQRHLWGDELGPRVDPIGQAATLEEGVRQLHEQPVQGGIPLTQAIDEMPWAQRRGAINRELKGAVEPSGELLGARMEANSPFKGMGSGEAGAINMKIFEDGFKAVKDLENGIRLVMQGRSNIGPVITAYDKAGQPVGELRLTPQDYPFVKASPKGNLEAGWVTTDPGKLTSKPDASRLAPTAKSQYPGLATEMYKFAAEQGNDIVRSGAQTPEGQAMWDRFESRGVSQNGVIRSPGNKQLGGLKLGPKTPKSDTIVEARSPETIKAKEELAAKAAALKVSGSQYERVTTLEEATAGIDASQDMSKAGANSLRSGSEGALRTNIKNKPLNFLRTKFQEARNEAEVMSKEYVTNKESGIISLWKALSKEEQADWVAMSKALDRQQVELTPEIMDKLGMTDGQRALSARVREALDHRYANVVKALGEQGLEPFSPRKGYFPSMFSGAYTSLIGFRDKTGHWVTTGIAQADTMYGHNKAVEAYKAMGDKYAEAIPLERRGLKSYVGTNKIYNGFTDLVNQLAKLDPAFGEAKAIADMKSADQVRALYRFDVHELKKNNIKGSLGDRPWLSQAENTRQAFEGLVNYLEEGFRYDSLMSPLNDIGKLINNPDMRMKMPNTTKYMEGYVSHVMGQNLNPVGAGVNWIIDQGFSAIGVSPKYPIAVVNGLAQVSTSLMMGFFNVGFAAMQFIQLPQAMLLEGSRFRQVSGLSHIDLAHSAMNSVRESTLIAAGKSELAQPHMTEAYQWARERGMFDYSEAELVHNLHKGTTRMVVEKTINSSISIPEKMTRPPMFMFMADLMHKAGFRGEDALLRAQAATDYAMVNYARDERAPIYQAMGQAGQALGALSAYKHNFIEQTVSNIANARKGQWESALVGTLVLGYGLYGIAGLPGYQEASDLVQKLSGKSLRELLLNNPEKPNSIMDGLASVVSGTDIQTRVSASSLLPDNALQAAPHISNSWNILSSAWEAAVNQDKASLQNFEYKAAPASVRNVMEATTLTDNNGWVRDTKGNLKVERPRSPEETRVRAILGLRPLDERLASESLWTQKQRETKKQEDLKKLSDRFASAIRLGEPVDGILKEVDALGGDSNALMNSIPSIYENSGKTPKERAEGTPGNSVTSLQRYQRFQQH